MSEPRPGLSPRIAVAFASAGFVALVIAGFGMLSLLTDTEVLPVDVRAAQVWAELRVRLRDAGRRANVNDLWIAAIAIANDLPVISQDDHFDALSELGALDVIKV